MRAVVSSGKSKRVVELPTWVELRVTPPLADDAPFHAHVVCKRCGRSVWFSGGPRQEDERALGRFATWHRRCPDRTLIQAAVEQAPLDRQAAADRDAWFARRRSGG